MASYFFLAFQMHVHSAELCLETLHAVVSCKFLYISYREYYLVVWSLVWEFYNFKWCNKAKLLHDMSWFFSHMQFSTISKQNPYIEGILIFGNYQFGWGKGSNIKYQSIYNCISHKDLHRLIMVDVHRWLFIDITSANMYLVREVLCRFNITQLGESFWLDRVCKVLYYWLVLRVFTNCLKIRTP